MDIFTLDKTNYESGRIINGIDSVLWVDRYLKAGEFTIIGEPNEALRSDLALGTLISHSDTLGVMMVENHVIDESKEGVNKLEISGRSVEAIALESRVAVMNPFFTWDGNLTNLDFAYTLTSNYSWIQAVSLIAGAIQASVFGSAENIPNVRVNHTITPPIGAVQKPRVVKRFDSIYNAALELLSYDQSGIKVKRPHLDEPRLSFIIHQGTYKTDLVRFNFDRGDIEKARYFWSNKNEKNSVYVANDLYGLRVRPAFTTGWDLKVTAINFESWQNSFNFGWPLSGEIYNNIDITLKSIANDVLSVHKTDALIDATVSRLAAARYDIDYEIGDLVYVEGNYGINSVMRVTEYARSKDAKGESGFPTLSAIL